MRKGIGFFQCPRVLVFAGGKVGINFLYHGIDFHCLVNHFFNIGVRIICAFGVIDVRQAKEPDDKSTHHPGRLRAAPP